MTLNISKNTIHVFILYTVLICSIIFGVRQCSNMMTLKDHSKHNIEALSDSVSYYKTKHGNVVSEKKILLGDINLLKQTNDSLYQVIKDMKLKQPDNIVYIETQVVNEKRDTVWLVSDDNVIYKDFDFSNEHRQLAGQVFKQDSLLGLNIHKDIVSANFTVAIENGKAYISSNNPYLFVNDIYGIQLPKTKPKRWGIGPYIGVGITTDGKVRPNLGLGVQYNIIQF